MDEISFLKYRLFSVRIFKNEVWTFVSNINDAWDRYENVKSIFILLNWYTKTFQVLLIWSPTLVLNYIQG